ncbi:MAG: ATP-binding protein [Clostridiales bacterium]|nr:ATP-binding protein [Clostridiales bacterium]MCF8022811.1 ATP-binding protein [Clostridiales bacterium]
MKKPKTQEESANSSSAVETCPYCGREKHPRTMELLGIKFTVTPSCQCEIDAFERKMDLLKNRQKRDAHKRMLSRSGLNGNAEEYTFENFEPRAGTEAALSFARNFARDFKSYSESGKGFVLIGPYGCGKSHLAGAVVHQLINREITASFRPVPELLKRVRASYNGSGETEAQLLDFLQKVQCLVLDDVGAHKQTEWAEEFLYTVIDHRYRYRLPTIITGNDTGSGGEVKLISALGERAVDRILERNTIIELTAQSYRREIARRRMRGQNKPERG